MMRKLFWFHSTSLLENKHWANSKEMMSPGKSIFILL